MTHYGIVGGGNHPQNIIEDGLRDVYYHDADHPLYVYCRKNASDSEKRVYNYILDNNIPFLAVTKDGSAPKVLVETADYIVDGGASAERTIIKELAANNGTLLILWDSENEQHMQCLVTEAFDLGVEVRELSNGLTPFIIEDTNEEAAESITETPTPKAEVELEPLTRDELDDMSIGLLKKAAFAQGIADAGGMTKQELVNVLVEEPEVAADFHVPAVPHVLPSEYAVVSWYENGLMQVAQLPLGEIKTLLSRSS